MPINIPRQFRESANVSPDYTVASNVTGIVTAALSMTAADLINPALSCTFALFILDPVLGWRLSRSARWVGDPTNVDTPSFAFAAGELAGRTVRMEYTVPVRMRIGLDVTGI